MDGGKGQISIGVREAARVLGINSQTVRKWIWRGKIPAVRIQNARGFHWQVLIDQVPIGLGDYSKPFLGSVDYGQSDCQERLEERSGDAATSDVEDCRLRLLLAESELADADEFAIQLRSNVESLRMQLKLLQAEGERTGDQIRRARSGD